MLTIVPQLGTLVLTICRGELEMEPSQQDLRQSAAEIFMESLDQLGQSLQVGLDASRSTAGDRPVKLPQASDGDRIDVEALEDAAADIEQFMQIDPSQTDQANLD